MTEPPRSLVQLIRRTYLVERVLAALDQRLVLIRAPAGFAKTETLAAVLRSLRRRGHTAIWLSIQRGWGRREILSALGSALGVPPDDVTSQVAAGANEVPIYLLLDQADHLQNDASAIDWILDALSEHFRVAIAGRTIPPLRLSRLRMRGLLAEIDYSELAFGRGEVQQIAGHWLRPEETERLWETLAGWPALVQLAANVLDRTDGVAERRLLLEGRHAILRDFVLEEVVPTLGETELAVLRACMDLQDFTLEIAAELAALPRSPETLHLVEGLAPLVLAQEQRRRWFRPHPVVTAALSAVSDETPDARARRHIQASEIFAARGHLEKAVLHASLAGDHLLAIRTIEAAGGADLFLRAGYTVLREIIQAVPHEVVLRSPPLRLCRCVTLAKSGLIREARAVVDGLAREIEIGEVEPEAHLLAILEHLSSLLNVYEDEGLDADGIASLNGRVKLARQEETWRLGWLHNNLAIAYTREDNLEAAQAHAIRALACYQEQRLSYPQVFMQIHLSFINYRANRIEIALAHGREAEELIGSRQWSDANLLAIAQVPIAAIRYQQGDVSGARQALERAMPIMAQGEGWVDFFAEGFGTLARARLDIDGWSSAREALDDGYAVADARELVRLRLALSILEVELLTRSGQLDAAWVAYRQLPDLCSFEEIATPRERDETVLAGARLALRRGEVDVARRDLEALGSACRGSVNRLEFLYRTSLVSVEAAFAAGEPALALAALQTAAEIAGPGEQVQQFLAEGPPLAEAVRAVVRRTGVSRLTATTSAYLATLARRQETVASGGILSARETQILALLDEGLSNKAIARRLDLAEPTVKFHLKNVYAKLGVSRRTLALSVARASGFITR